MFAKSLVLKPPCQPTFSSDYRSKKAVWWHKLARCCSRRHFSFLCRSLGPACSSHFMHHDFRVQNSSIARFMEHVSRLSTAHQPTP